MIKLCYTSSRILYHVTNLSNDNWLFPIKVQNVIELITEKVQIMYLNFTKRANKTFFFNRFMYIHSYFQIYYIDTRIFYIFIRQNVIKVAYFIIFKGKLLKMLFFCVLVPIKLCLTVLTRKAISLLFIYYMNILYLPRKSMY